jgi:hypothetical protein
MFEFWERWKKKRYRDRYGLPGDDPAIDQAQQEAERRKLEEVEKLKHENDIRIARIEGAVRVLTTRVQSNSKRITALEEKTK